MKTKFAIIYAVAGIAFLAVSLWVFLSGGKSARAVRSKYRLGGMMLAASSMLSAASCKVPIPSVTCYEPMVTCYDVPMKTDEVSLSVKGREGTDVAAGDVLVVSISSPGFNSYICRIWTVDEEPVLLQSGTFTFENVTDPLTLELKIGKTSYHGAARVELAGLYKTESDSEFTEVQTGNGNLAINYL